MLFAPIGFTSATSGAPTLTRLYAVRVESTVLLFITIDSLPSSSTSEINRAIENASSPATANNPPATTRRLRLDFRLSLLIIVNLSAWQLQPHENIAAQPSILRQRP